MTYLLSHRRHILSPNLPARRLPDEQPNCVVLAEDEHIWIADAARLDLRTGHVALHVLDNLPFVAVYRGICERMRLI